MPIELEIATDERIDLEEFRRRVLDKVDPEDDASLASVAADLVALANNRDILLLQITCDIGMWRRPDFAMYSAQSCVLDRFGPYTVRANLWPSVVTTEGEFSALSYNSYHDHNFSFLTTNLYGPGYRTDLYELLPSSDGMEVAQVVDLRPVGEWILGPGRVVLYTKGTDVHAQIPPASPSASLNLIVSGPEVLYGDQFYFDPVRSMAIGMVENVVAKRMSLLELGKYVAGPSSLQSLSAVASECRCSRSAAIAREVLRMLG